MKSYHPLLEAVTNPPPEEDSEDLTDVEVENAIPTEKADDLAHLIAEEVKHNPDSPETGGFTVQAHELRRRGEHLYWRVRLVSSSEPVKILVFQVDWLKKG